ncbi:MAG: P-type conjugative transfer protein TrbL [Candidatus Omnitrophica bacterium]|nr:P-type conjugative transfer protein TrbL [Candidatus Omnitrophota bacterium]
MNSTVMTIFNQLTGQYSHSIATIQSGSIVLGKELFNAIALLSVGLLGIHHLLRKQVDMVDANFELIRWLIYLNIFYLLITRYDQFLPTIVNSFQQAGAYLGGGISGNYSVPTPGSIISNGFDVAFIILKIGLKQTMFLNLGMTLVSIAAVIVILYCFGMIAIELLLLQIGSQIILAGGIFLLAFAGLQWTREYAEKYIHTFFQIGMKMLFMYILIGIGYGLTQNWSKALSNIPANLILQYDFAVVMATFVFYMLSQKIPEQATVYFTGRFPMSFEPVPALPTLARGVFSAGKKVVDMREKNIANIAENKMAQAGEIKAMDVAKQAALAKFAQEGKTPNANEIQQEAIKTLGEAKQALWEKKVAETQGGKMAKIILDKMPDINEKPEPEPETVSSENSIGSA